MCVCVLNFTDFAFVSVFILILFNIFLLVFVQLWYVMWFDVYKRFFQYIHVFSYKCVMFVCVCVNHCIWYSAWFAFVFVAISAIRINIQSQRLPHLMTIPCCYCCSCSLGRERKKEQKMTHTNRSFYNRTYIFYFCRNYWMFFISQKKKSPTSLPFALYWNASKFANTLNQIRIKHNSPNKSKNKAKKTRHSSLSVWIYLQLCVFI